MQIQAMRKHLVCKSKECTSYACAGKACASKLRVGNALVSNAALRRAKTCEDSASVTGLRKRTLVTAVHLEVYWFVVPCILFVLGYPLSARCAIVLVSVADVVSAT